MPGTAARAFPAVYPSILLSASPRRTTQILHTCRAVAEAVCRGMADNRPSWNPVETPAIICARTRFALCANDRYEDIVEACCDAWTDLIAARLARTNNASATGQSDVNSVNARPASGRCSFQRSLLFRRTTGVHFRWGKWASLKGLVPGIIDK